MSFDEKRLLEVKGRFDQYIKIRLWTGTGEKGDTKVENLGGGKYRRVCTGSKIPLPKMLCSTIGIEPVADIIEEITITPGKFFCKVRTPTALRKLVDFEEELTVTVSGSKLVAVLTMKGTIYVSVGTSILKNIYVKERVGRIKADLIESGGEEIPQ